MYGRPQPKPRVGKCFCGGTVTETFYTQAVTPDIIGPGQGVTWVSGGLHCTTCGIKYAFIKKEEAKDA